jgi:hypothetical protein
MELNIFLENQRPPEETSFVRIENSQVFFQQILDFAILSLVTLDLLLLANITSQWKHHVKSTKTVIK